MLKYFHACDLMYIWDVWMSIYILQHIIITLGDVEAERVIWIDHTACNYKIFLSLFIYISLPISLPWYTHAFYTLRWFTNNVGNNTPHHHQRDREEREREGSMRESERKRKRKRKGMGDNQTRVGPCIGRSEEGEGERRGEARGNGEGLLGRRIRPIFLLFLFVAI